jgi:hypothetical protein
VFYPVRFRLQIAGHVQPPFPDGRVFGAFGKFAIPAGKLAQLDGVLRVDLVLGGDARQNRVRHRMPDRMDQP